MTEKNKLNLILHPNQVSVAVALGVEVQSTDSVPTVIAAIESKLGVGAELESARWFAVSVLRHLRKEKWTEPRDSGLEDSELKELAEDCLAVKGFSTSLRTVTKDVRSKYRIVGFSSSKKVERVILATGTKAYKIAAAVIADAGLLNARQQTAEQEKPPSKSEDAERSAAPPFDEKTAVARRAKRRGYSEEGFMDAVAATQAPASKKQTEDMSEEEFANLDAALSKNDAEIPQQNWVDQRNEDRWSRILGLLAGVGFFVFVALLFL